MPSDITGTEVIQEDQATGDRAVQVPARARSSPTSSWPTRSTARPPRRRPPCSRRCRSARSPSAASGIALPDPFFVLATQNPIEQEGTYPLPEAQLDRFMFNIHVDYPERGGRARDRPAHHVDAAAGGRRRCSPATRSWSCRRSSARCPSPTTCMRYALRLTRLTRRDQADVPDFVSDYVELGRRPAGQPVPGPRRQGPGRPPRPLPRHDRRHPRGRPPRAPAPHHHQLQRRGRGAQARRHRQAAGQGDPDRRARGRTEWKTTRSI